MKKTVLLFVFLFSAFIGFSQAIDNTSSIRRMDGDKYVRLNYENDFFTATDRYYTQGVSLEFVHPGLGKFPLSYLLLRPTGYHISYGLSYELDGYTPSSIRHDEIIYGDRPFAGVMLLKSFNIAVDSASHNRFSSNFSIGMIGPAGGGEEIQYNIHKWLHNILPLGWQHQIHNDVLVNYGISHEKQLLNLGDWLTLNSHADVELGTLSDKAGLGAILAIGNSANSFTKTKNKLRVRVYEQPQINLIAYDATLEGGVFNHSSPYTIAPNQITRITFQNNAGIVFNIGKLYLEYFQSYLTKEFQTGLFHRWGGVRVGMVF